MLEAMTDVLGSGLDSVDLQYRIGVLFLCTWRLRRLEIDLIYRVEAETVSASYAVEESRSYDAFIQSFLPLISGNWT
jgi:hypothetical protein